MDRKEEGGSPEHGQEVLVSWVQPESKVLLSLFLDLFCKQVSTFPLSFSKKGNRDRSRACIMFNFIKLLAGKTKENIG